METNKSRTDRLRPELAPGGIVLGLSFPQQEDKRLAYDNNIMRHNNDDRCFTRAWDVPMPYKNTKQRWWQDR